MGKNARMEGKAPILSRKGGHDQGCGSIYSSLLHECFQASDTRIWDPGQLAEYFLPWEVEMVARILLCENWDEDILIWPLTSDGEYSVCSAYRMLVAVECSSMLSSSSLNPSQAFWKAICKIMVPNKIRHFVWRAVKDSLPTKQNLKKRRVSVDDICDGCGDHVELILHCLWLRERQTSWQLHEIGEKASALVHEFWEVHKQEVRNPVRRPPVHWSPPPDACYKGNFDTALFDGSDCAGIGVVFRDSSGNVITALSQ
ncbi:hypothetical protein SO802_023699 [Lithocarpus litseifolius]|uniref:Reverse transcriptase zinc-binding domain-containing protein n=1 Tax=Lithocarpus litseifolius TaxID=425828 RepID=A0AAW2C6Z1_9ROSI